VLGRKHGVGSEIGTADAHGHQNVGMARDALGFLLHRLQFRVRHPGGQIPPTQAFRARAGAAFQTIRRLRPRPQEFVPFLRGQECLGPGDVQPDPLIRLHVVAFLASGPVLIVLFPVHAQDNALSSGNKTVKTMIPGTS